MGSSLIVWELVLVVVAVAGFAFWQLWSLKRDGEALRRQQEAEAAKAERERQKPGAADQTIDRNVPPGKH